MSMRISRHWTDPIYLLSTKFSTHRFAVWRSAVNNANRGQESVDSWQASLWMMQIVNFYEPFSYLPRRIIQRSVSRNSLTKKNFRDMQLFWRLSLVRYDTWHRQEKQDTRNSPGPLVTMKTRFFPNTPCANCSANMVDSVKNLPA